MTTTELLAITKQAIETIDAKGTLTGEDLRTHNELCGAYNNLLAIKQLEDNE